MRTLRLILLATCSCGWLHAQDEDAKATQSAKPAAPLERNYSSLVSLSERITESRKALKTGVDVDKQELEKRLNEMADQFREIVAGNEDKVFQPESDQKVTIQDQISEILRPLVNEARAATSRPREIDGLKEQWSIWKSREAAAATVLERIREFENLDADKKLGKAMRDTRRLWEDRLADAKVQQDAYRTRLELLQSNRKPTFEMISDAMARFFKTRGLNLLLSVAAAVLGFLIMRKLYAVFRKYSPVHRGRRTLASRLSDIIALGVAVLVGLLGVLIVYFVRGDWLLLTLALILIFGVVWASKTALPPYIGQLRLLLNLGAVREGERVVFRGVPWRVKTLGFLTDLENPTLQGGRLRVPVKEMMDMISREADDKEPWFPCEAGDWVRLSDDTLGKVITQSPEQTVVLRLGGSTKTYATSSFLDATPENLSHGFRIISTFGIDYAHQRDVVEKIPAIMQRALHEALVADFGRDAVKSVQVELAAAAASSLDFEVITDFDGLVAARYNVLQRRIQRTCVALCNEHGWVIPFTQVTVHQAS